MRSGDTNRSEIDALDLGINSPPWQSTFLAWASTSCPPSRPIGMNASNSEEAGKHSPTAPPSPPTRIMLKPKPRRKKWTKRPAFPRHMSTLDAGDSMQKMPIGKRKFSPEPEQLQSPAKKRPDADFGTEDPGTINSTSLTLFWPVSYSYTKIPIPTVPRCKSLGAGDPAMGRRWWSSSSCDAQTRFSFHHTTLQDPFPPDLDHIEFQEISDRPGWTEGLDTLSGRHLDEDGITFDLENCCPDV